MSANIRTAKTFSEQLPQRSVKQILPAPGGTVTGDVTFTAVPQNGYTLKSWKITDAENNTDIVNAAGSNTYTLTLGSTRYTVEAEFERVSETDRPVKLTYSVASGNETGMAATKQTYQSVPLFPWERKSTSSLRRQKAIGCKSSLSPKTEFPTR